ncbi:hypothetical protein SAMN03159448_05041 [Sinorhizobium sp. NFACC03]|nr:hypothetical protein SAMN03159448_05041 [Sinorhizobium sp. NFACC03]
MRRHENISDCGKDRDETLQAADRSKSLHYPLSFSKRHMRILRAIVGELLHGGELHALGAILNQFLVRPFGRLNALLEISKSLLASVKLERPDGL